MDLSGVTQMLATASRGSARYQPPRPPLRNTICTVKGCGVDVEAAFALACEHFVCEEHQLVTFVENQLNIDDAAAFSEISGNMTGSEESSLFTTLTVAERCPHKCSVSATMTIPRIPACPPVIAEHIRLRRLEDNIRKLKDHRYQTAHDLHHLPYRRSPPIRLASD